MQLVHRAGGSMMAGHRFWEQGDEKSRAQQTIHFLKNLSMRGGLVMVATNGG